MSRYILAVLVLALALVLPACRLDNPPQAAVERSPGDVRATFTIELTVTEGVPPPEGLFVYMSDGTTPLVSYDFGQVPQGSSQVLHFIVANESETTFTVSAEVLGATWGTAEISPAVQQFDPHLAAGYELVVTPSFDTAAGTTVTATVQFVEQ